MNDDSNSDFPTKKKVKDTSAMQFEPLIRQAEKKTQVKSIVFFLAT